MGMVEVDGDTGNTPFSRSYPVFDSILISINVTGLGTVTRSPTKLVGPKSPTTAESNAQKAIKDNSLGSDTYKEIIFRLDDGSEFTPALEWISDLLIRKNIKITYAVIPTNSLNQNLIKYLNKLDSNNFEMAVHVNVNKEPYLGQYALINRATKIMLLAFHKRPESFVPPSSKADSGTIRALKALKYQPITTDEVISDNNPSDLEQFTGDIYWELTSDSTEKSFEEKFDKVYNSPKKTILIGLHTNDPYLRQNATQLKKFVDYIKKRSVKFVTIEEAHRLHELVRQATKLQEQVRQKVSGKWSMKFNDRTDRSLDLNLWSSSGTTIMGYGTLTEEGAKNSVTVSGSITESELTLIAKSAAPNSVNEKNKEYDLDLLMINNTLSGTYVLKLGGQFSDKGNATAVKE